MTRRAATSTRSASDGASVVQAVTVIMGVVVGLTFLFGFGNVLNLALRLGVPVWVAPLVAPAVDLSILGLLLGSRHLALMGVPSAQLRAARRLLIFASVVTLALNVADPFMTGQYGKAAFDAVGPLLLIGWAEVGPDLLRALTTASRLTEEAPCEVNGMRESFADGTTVVERMTPESSSDEVKPADTAADKQTNRPASTMVDDHLLARAREENLRHWNAHRRPISADTLRKKLRIGAARSRLLVAVVRADSQGRSAQDRVTAQIGA